MQPNFLCMKISCLSGIVLKFVFTTSKLLCVALSFSLDLITHDLDLLCEESSVNKLIYIINLLFFIGA